MQPTRYTNSWTRNTFIIELLLQVSALSAIVRGTTLILQEAPPPSYVLLITTEEISIIHH
jgi:hypothetical protein